ncbi:MAG: hypothetical protein KBT48_00205, partial [Firmicutes bacterium]|nr:hypothetical protein [Bacillota bacterium]
QKREKKLQEENELHLKKEEKHQKEKQKFLKEIEMSQKREKKLQKENEQNKLYLFGLIAKGKLELDDLIERFGISKDELEKEYNAIYPSGLN